MSCCVGVFFLVEIELKKTRRRKYLTAAEKDMVEEQQEKEERMWSVPSNTNKTVCQL
jgi:hypothetical protein